MNFAAACSTLCIDPRLLLAERLDDCVKEAAINSAYRRLSLLHHPDKHPNDLGAQARFEKLVKAKEFLLRDLGCESTLDERYQRHPFS